jgi:hypothetical protein
MVSTCTTSFVWLMSAGGGVLLSQLERGGDAREHGGVRQLWRGTVERHGVRVNT